MDRRAVSDCVIAALAAFAALAAIIQLAFPSEPPLLIDDVVAVDEPDVRPVSAPSSCLPPKPRTFYHPWEQAPKGAPDTRTIA